MLSRKVKKGVDTGKKGVKGKREEEESKCIIF
jgi:hypothetical protein